jgi:hypothetical protein
MKTRPSSARLDPKPAGSFVLCVLWVAGALLFDGCANTTEVKIDSLAKPKAEEAISYKIHNANPAVSEDTLRHQEAVGFVRTALSGKGMYETTDADKADVVVDLDYGVGPPKLQRETVQEPVYATLPGEVRVERVQVGTDKSGNPIFSTVTVQDPPRTEMIGYRDHIIETIVYEKHLRLSAKDNKPASEGQPPAEIWTIDVTSEGESHDLRKTLPILAAASIDYIGKDSHGEKIIRLKDTDKDIAFVKKGM